MIQLTLERNYKGPKYTIGKLYIDGKYFCDTLEDKDRGLKDSMTEEYIRLNKVYGETAIPSGTYIVNMNIVSPKYSNFNKYGWAKPYGGKIPRLMDVKGFDGVLIHPGNTTEDTKGCILVGQNKVKGKVLNSLLTWGKLMDILVKDRNHIKITIK